MTAPDKPIGPWMRIYYQSANEAGDKRHAQTIMKELGIKYQESEPFTIADCWLFYGIDVTTIPKDLPDYVEFFKDEKTYTPSKGFKV